MSDTTDRRRWMQAEDEVDALRDELAALRAAVSALADECERAIGAAQQPDITPLRFRDVADRLRYLASVGSSGEAESGERDDDAHGIGLDGRCHACAPAPVSSGGQADGEGEDDGWDVIVHVPARAGMSAYHLLHAQVGESVFRFLDEHLPHRVWDPFVHGQPAVETAARPVLSREALEGRVLTALARTAGKSLQAKADAVLDVLAGGEHRG